MYERIKWKIDDLNKFNGKLNITFNGVIQYFEK
jgi:hypothetical protein